MTPFIKLILATIIALASFGTMTVAAQEASPAATPAGPSAGFPVAIHEGTCDAPTAEPVAQLDDATVTPADDDTADVIGQAVSNALAQSTGTVDLTFDNVTETPYIIAVHASAEEFGTIVACGQIAGFDDEGTLAVALTPVNGSSTVGVAILESSDVEGVDVEDTQLFATVYVFSTSADDATA